MRYKILSGSSITFGARQLGEDIVDFNTLLFEHVGAFYRELLEKADGSMICIA
ncbi:hypothetical protein SAMN05446935_9576 [Burkholderia sp. YR290]|jgi:hypothetical protein|uniref:hypothetical protein n=1 Tax=Paraburkholderia hospita TaxID=169430 RepID=UPI0009CAC965|nr:hypothetical protein [Paraburkholderia hospita]SKC96165.1 hypothetical protein SAMN05446934_6932 [Paraburkholderia hospita]SOE90289.1 hypothetical protein SAMN05446935_9576 [Burkholderia sp. YR290]